MKLIMPIKELKSLPFPVEAKPCWGLFKYPKDYFFEMDSDPKIVLEYKISGEEKKDFNWKKTSEWLVQYLTWKIDVLTKPHKTIMNKEHEEDHEEERRDHLIIHEVGGVEWYMEHKGKSPFPYFENPNDASSGYKKTFRYKQSQLFILDEANKYFLDHYGSDTSPEFKEKFIKWFLKAEDFYFRVRTIAEIASLPLNIMIWLMDELDKLEDSNLDMIDAPRKEGLHEKFENNPLVKISRRAEASRKVFKREMEEDQRVKKLLHLVFSDEIYYQNYPSPGYFFSYIKEDLYLLYPRLWDNLIDEELLLNESNPFSTDRIPFDEELLFLPKPGYFEVKNNKPEKEFIQALMECENTLEISFKEQDLKPLNASSDLIKTNLDFKNYVLNAPLIMEKKRIKLQNQKYGKDILTNLKDIVSTLNPFKGGILERFDSERISADCLDYVYNEPNSKIEIYAWGEKSHPNFKFYLQGFIEANDTLNNVRMLEVRWIKDAFMDSEWFNYEMFSQIKLKSTPLNEDLIYHIHSLYEGILRFDENHLIINWNSQEGLKRLLKELFFQDLIGKMNIRPITKTFCRKLSRYLCFNDTTPLLNPESIKDLEHFPDFEMPQTYKKDELGWWISGYLSTGNLLVEYWPIYKNNWKNFVLVLLYNCLGSKQDESHESLEKTVKGMIKWTLKNISYEKVRVDMESKLQFVPIIKIRLKYEFEIIQLIEDYLDLKMIKCLKKYYSKAGVEYFILDPENIIKVAQLWEEFPCYTSIKEEVQNAIEHLETNLKNNSVDYLPILNCLRNSKY